MLVIMVSSEFIRTPQEAVHVKFTGGKTNRFSLFVSAGLLKICFLANRKLHLSGKIRPKYDNGATIDDPRPTLQGVKN